MGLRVIFLGSTSVALTAAASASTFTGMSSRSPDPSAGRDVSERENQPGRAGAKSARTRQRLVSSAAELFAARSFDAVSVRAIAKAAGVDPALINHYFGSKEGLFQAVMEASLRPERVEAEVLSSSREEWGHSIVRAVERAWTSPAAYGLSAIVRRAIAGNQNLISAFVSRAFLPRLAQLLDCPEPERSLRAGLAGAQIAGLVLARHVVRVDPLASLTSDQIVGLIGPVVQHYLTGAIGAEGLCGDDI